MKRRKEMEYRKGGSAFLVAALALVLTTGATLDARAWGDPVLPDGYKYEVLTTSLTGLRFNDVVITPSGEPIISIVSQSRAPCESFIAGIGPEGELTHFADICQDNPMPMAFGPLTGDLLYFVERAGWDDDVYTVPSHGTPADKTLILARKFVSIKDIAFDSAGNLYFAENWYGKVYKLAPSGELTLFASGFTVESANSAGAADMGLLVDANDNLILADRLLGSIFKISPAGEVSLFSTAVPHPGSMTFSPEGSLFVTDTQAGTIYWVAEDGSATAIFSGLTNPLEIEFGPNGFLYVLEWNTIASTWPETRLSKIYQPVIPATVDVKPDTLNKRDNGHYVTAHIELPDLDPNDIVIDSVAVVKINGEPVDPALYALLSPTAVGDYDEDGIPDLKVKFDRSEFIALVPLGDVEVGISGTLTSGTNFYGADTISVIDNCQQGGCAMSENGSASALPLLAILPLLLLLRRRKINN